MHRNSRAGTGSQLSWRRNCFESLATGIVCFLGLSEGCFVKRCVCNVVVERVWCAWSRGTVERRSRQLLMRRGMGDKLEVLLHGFVAAARRRWEGGWKGGSERRSSKPASMQATSVDPTKKMNRRHKSFFSCAIKNNFHPIKKYFRPIKKFHFLRCNKNIIYV
jgi:hypothetical protein